MKVADTAAHRPPSPPPILPVDAAALEAAFPSLEGRWLLLDFDETLWLRNSTEAFLAAARPGFLAWLLLLPVRVSRPLWRPRAPSDLGHRQDWLRIRVVTLLMPWTLSRWRRRARALGEERRNLRLIGLVERARPARIVVVTNGFAPVVAPLLEGIGLKVDTLVAAPLRGGGAWRMRGKVANVAAALPAAALDRACFVTDHPDDAALLGRVATGLLCKWPEARYIRAPF